MEKFKNGVKEFITVFIKFIVFIALIVLLIYLFFVLADFVKARFDIDLYGPAGILGAIFVAVAFTLMWYRRIMNIIE
ncbi:hypothetical protein H0W91_03285 [Patescibacteria group bacterium]|nr:hypothetical protein [Patescibacteria group bacterium]